MNQHLSEIDDTLVAAVGKATGASAVRSVEHVQSLWSDYGAILRLVLDGGSRPSVIVKRVRWPTTSNHPRGWNTSTSHDRKVRSYRVEANFYRDFAPRCTPPCHIPRLLDEMHGDAGVVLILEDLDDSGFAGRRTHASQTDIRGCLDWLAHFHAAFIGVEPAGLWSTGTYWHLDTRPDELAAMNNEDLRRAAPLLDEQLRQSRYQTLVHGDAKLANFCFDDDTGRVAAVDYQYVGGGPGIKDVAYFIGSCLDEDECATQESRLLDFYFDRLRSVLTRREDIDVDVLVHDWRTLYPIAWTDFYRFLDGWSPGHWKVHGYTRRLAKEALEKL